MDEDSEFDDIEHHLMALTVDQSLPWHASDAQVVIHKKTSIEPDGLRTGPCRKCICLSEVHPRLSSSMLSKP